jgi:hypothetical protein
LPSILGFVREIASLGSKAIFEMGFNKKEKVNHEFRYPNKFEFFALIRFGQHAADCIFDLVFKTNFFIFWQNIQKQQIDSFLGGLTECAINLSKEH